MTTLVGILLGQSVGAAPRDGPASQRGVVLDFESASLEAVIRAVSDATGQRFLFDPEKLKGKISITSQDEVDSDEAREILNAALLLSGFAVIPGPGGVSRIAEIHDIASGAPWDLDSPRENRGAPIATILRLRWAEPGEITAALRPFLSPATVAVPYPRSNSIILAGAEDRLRRLWVLAEALDRATVEELAIFRLRHVTTDEVAGQVRTVFGARPGQAPRFEVWTEPRTNALLVRASEPVIGEIRDFLARIDQPLVGEGAIAVLPVHHRDAEEIAQLLEGLAAGAGVGPAKASAEVLLGRDFSLAVDRPTHSLVARGDRETRRILRELVAEFDRMPPRILVEATVFEMSVGEGLSLGIDFFTPLTNPKDPRDLISTLLSNPSGGGLQAEPSGESFFARFTRAPLLIPLTVAGQTVTLLVPRESAVVRADARDVRFRTLMRPSLVVLSGDEHELFAGDNIPIAVGQTEDVSGQGLQIQQNIERHDVGVRLRVEPTVGERGGVNLDLDLEVTAVTGSLVGDSTRVGPTLLHRQLESKIRIEDGEMVVAGMATDDVLEMNTTGTPFFMKIPVLGYLFKRTERRVVKRHIILAVQARILRSPDEDLAESIRQRLAMQRNLARVKALEKSDGPYAVRVATLREASEADRIATELGGRDERTTVKRWEDASGDYYDVYLVEFESLVAAGTAARSLRSLGLDSEVTVVGVDL